jgi:DNA-binding CsgD family transcriptional regulator/tetratricopeptide (TPR) repeat protein
VSRRISSPLIVGRAEALAALSSALVRAEEGEPAAVLVSGEAGVGKTRLVREAIGGESGSGAQVLWGECVATGNGELPYAPIVGALRPLARSLQSAAGGDVLGGAREELSRLLPALGRSAGFAPATPASPARLFELLLGVLERLGDQAPVVLVIEDVHWADVATEQLLAFLVRNLRSERLLLVVTWRTDEPGLRGSLHRLLAELVRDERVEHVELAPLTGEETARQISGIVGGPADAALADWAYRRGGGNPYFTEELVATRAGRLEATVPDSLRAVLLARMALVPEPAREVLRIAAAAEDRVDHAVLQRATGLGDSEVAAAVHELLDAHVLVRGRDSSAYGFRHALAREALYSELLAPERQALHARLAAALDATFGEPERGAAEWSALAHHWDAAGDAPRALGAAIAAGGAATTVYAFADAERQLERARRLWGEVAAADRPEDIDESELLRRLAEAARLAGQWDDAIPIAEAALAALPPAVDPRRIARIELLLSTLHRDTDAAVGHARRALALLPPGPSAERSAAVLRLATAHAYGALPSDTRERALEALEAARAAGVAADMGAAHRMIGAALAWGGHAEAGLTNLRKACDMALEHDRGEDYVRAVDWLGAALMMLGRTDEALGVYQGAMEQVRRDGLALSHGIWIETNAAECELRLGRWAAARTRLVRLVALRSQHADTRLATLAVTLLLAAREGEDGDTAGQEEEAVALLDANVSRGAVAIAFSALAELALARGDPERAWVLVASARRRIGMGDLQYWPALLSLGLRAEGDLAERARARGEHVPEDAGRRAAALELVGEINWYIFEDRLGAPEPERAPPETVAHWRIADAELARIDGVPRPDLWSEIAGYWDALAQPYQGIYARLREAEALLAIGDRRESAGALRAAHAAALALGAGPVRGDVEALAKRARIALPVSAAEPPAAGPPLDLTRRELTVLERVADGRTNRQIAEELYLSPRTVDVHVRHILAKLHAANRVEAAGIAHRLGIGSPG